MNFIYYKFYLIEIDIRNKRLSEKHVRLTHPEIQRKRVQYDHNSADVEEDTVSHLLSK